jgi:hypothetical protein
MSLQKIPGWRILLCNKVLPFFCAGFSQVSFCVCNYTCIMYISWRILLYTYVYIYIYIYIHIIFIYTYIIHIHACTPQNSDFLRNSIFVRRGKKNHDVKRRKRTVDLMMMMMAMTTDRAEGTTQIRKMKIVATNRRRIFRD